MSGTPPPLLLVVLVPILGLATACGGSGGDSGGGGEGESASVPGGGVPVKAKEYAFEPAEITASAGEVTFHLRNAGSLEHDLTIDEPKFKLSALAGRTRSATVELEQGTYEVYCSIAGHKAAGMEGKLTVD